MRPAIGQLKGKKNLVGAEIGVLTGTNANNMLMGLDLKKLYLVDPYNITEQYTGGMAHYKTALGVLKNYEDIIRWFILPSVEAAPFVKNESLDFVYIDGLHSFDHCFNDITAWYPKVKKGGVVGGHDYPADSVERAVRTFVGENDVKNLTPDLAEGDWYFIK